MAAPTLTPGETLGHFRLIEEIGAGGMGVVYRAWDTRLEREVAVKALNRRRGSATERKRLRKEALALSRLNHPNIERIYSIESDGELDFLVFELLSGSTLADCIHGPLDEANIVRLGIQLAGAVAAAHQSGVIHRDLKPENIFLTKEGDAKVLDFGLARVAMFVEGPTESVEQQGHLVGTLPYMAPEQIDPGVDDERSDIYSLGAVLYVMATGQRPFTRNTTTRLIEAILHEHPVPPRTENLSLAPELERIILKCLQKNPNARYQSARDIAVELKRMLPPGALDSWDSRTIPAPPKRWHSSTIILVMLLLLAVAVGVTLWRRLQGRASRPPLSVVVADFENRTGDPVFDQTPRELMSTALGQSKQVSVFPISRLPDVLKRMQKPETAAIDENVGREICTREGLQSVISGSVTKLGSRYLLQARVLDCKGDLIVSSQKEFSRPEELPSAIEDATKAIRSKWGEPGAAINQVSQPLALATSSSLEAVKLYSSGKQQLYLGNPRAAVALFTKAVELDDSFAMAHAYLGSTYVHLNDQVRAGQEYSKAAQLAGRVSEREREKILGDYALFRNDVGEAISHYQVLAALSPDDPAAHVNLAECYVKQLRFDAAIVEARKAADLEPSPGPRENLAAYYFLNGDSQQAFDVAQQVLKENPDDMVALYLVGSYYLATGKPALADRSWHQLLALGGEAASQASAAMADAAQTRDNLEEAIDQLERGAIADAELGNAYELFRKQILLAELHHAAGDRPALVGVHEPGSPDLIFLLGRLYARLGRRAEAQRELHRLDRWDDKTPSVISFSDMLRSEMAADEGDLTAGVEWARRGVEHRNSTLAIETLARAYERAGQREAAVHQYELLLTRGNERQFDSVDSPALHAVAASRYRLGVLYQSLGRDDLARQQFSSFLSYAGDTDRTGPLYEDAKRRMGRLTLKTASPADPLPPHTAPPH